MIEEERRAFKLEGDTEVCIPFDLLKKGDRFRLDEPTGEHVLNNDGNVWNLAEEDPKDGHILAAPIVGAAWRSGGFGHYRKN